MVTEIDILRIRDEKIVDSWSTLDSLGLLRQLGVGPVATAAAQWRPSLSRAAGRDGPDPVPGTKGAVEYRRKT